MVLTLGLELPVESLTCAVRPRKVQTASVDTHEGKTLTLHEDIAVIIAITAALIAVRRAPRLRGSDVFGSRQNFDTLGDSNGNPQE
jgi:hypothetical protein